MVKVLLVFGTRPEAIKMCPLVKKLRQSSVIDCKVCLTGQHREMLDQVVNLFGIVADYDLNIMKPNQTLASITTDIISGIGRIFENEIPDIVLVHGDTTTAFATALSAFYHHVKIGHVEAGLRTYNMDAPYPEEFNRQAIDLLADIFFAPTEYAQNNLISEGKIKEKIFVTGNTVIDALKTTVDDEYTDDNLKWADGHKLILFTAHRRENIGNSMIHMFNAIKRIALEYSDVRVIYPIHKNPKVYKLAEEKLGNISNIRLIQPLDVITFHNYMNNCYLVLTDSGGIQEEAPSLGKPVLVMRDATERPEGVKAGTLKLVGTDENSIYYHTKKLLDDKIEYKNMAESINPYGDGHASDKIVEIIEKIYKNNH